MEYAGCGTGICDGYNALGVGVAKRAGARSAQRCASIDVQMLGPTGFGHGASRSTAHRRAHGEFGSSWIRRIRVGNGDHMQSIDPYEVIGIARVNRQPIGQGRCSNHGVIGARGALPSAVPK
jgi:hypothetical protein